MNTPTPTPAQRSEFQQLAMDMSCQFIKAIEGYQSPYVVMEALLIVHRYTVHQLPPEVIGQVSMAIAAYAGELLQSSASTQSAPAGTPVH